MCTPKCTFRTRQHPECGLGRRVLTPIPAHGGSLQWYGPHPVPPPLLFSISLSRCGAISLSLSPSVSLCLPLHSCLSPSVSQSLSLSGSLSVSFCIPFGLPLSCSLSLSVSLSLPPAPMFPSFSLLPTEPACQRFQETPTVGARTRKKRGIRTPSPYPPEICENLCGCRSTRSHLRSPSLRVHYHRCAGPATRLL